MEVLLAVATGVLTACAVHLILSRHLLRVAIGLVLFGNAANLIIFQAGRLGPLAPPIIDPEQGVLGAAVANPLPQALVLTAIVISFGLVAFTLVLLLKGHERLGTIDADDLRETDRPAGSAKETVPAPPRQEAA